MGRSVDGWGGRMRVDGGGWYVPTLSLLFAESIDAAAVVNNIILVVSK